VTVEVLAVDHKGDPVELAIDFAVDLEAPSLRWRWWGWDTEYNMRMDVPEVGQTLSLPGPFISSPPAHPVPGPGDKRF
jgi:hypothetical protein